MKKILMTMAAAFVAVTMSAQVYLGGSIGVASVKDSNADAETLFKIVPEVGYNINAAWAVGVSLGYQKGTCDLMSDFFDAGTQEIFQINPYVRYTFINSKLINVFVDGGVDFSSYKDAGTGLNFGFKPGVAVNLSDNLSFVAHVGFIGYKSYNPKADGLDTRNKVGVDLNGNNLLFGLYYNF